MDGENIATLKSRLCVHGLAVSIDARVAPVGFARAPNAASASSSGIATLFRTMGALAVTAGLFALGTAPTEAQAQSACPTGYSYQSEGARCVSIVQPICPTFEHWLYARNGNVCGLNASGPTWKRWVMDGAPKVVPVTCPAGYTYRAASIDCFRSVPASCPRGTHLDARTGRCPAGIATPQ